MAELWYVLHEMYIFQLLNHNKHGVKNKMDINLIYISFWIRLRTNTRLFCSLKSEFWLSFSCVYLFALCVVINDVLIIHKVTKYAFRSSNYLIHTSNLLQQIKLGAMHNACIYVTCPFSSHAKVDLKCTHSPLWHLGLFDLII